MRIGSMGQSVTQVERACKQMPTHSHSPQSPCAISTTGASGCCGSFRSRNGHLLRHNLHPQRPWLERHNRTVGRNRANEHIFAFAPPRHFVGAAIPHDDTTPLTPDFEMQRFVPQRIFDDRRHGHLGKDDENGGGGQLRARCTVGVRGVALVA